MERALFEIRIALLQAFLRAHGHDGILITRPDNYAMATGGKRNPIWMHSDAGANSLFVDRDGRAWFIGNTIEQPRQMDEELGALGCAAHGFLWFEDHAASAAGKHFPGSLVSDDGSLGPNVNAALAPLRSLLTEYELEKYRALGRLAGEAMEATLATIQPGAAEADIAATLVAEGQRRRCQVPVALVAADDRIAKYRHPLPTVAPLIGEGGETAVRRYVMVVGCFLREGLVVSLTRFKRVDDLPEGVVDAHARVCGVDARMQEATRPGRTLGDVFNDCQAAYTDLGFALNEWHNHHQGGATGYAGRTCKGAPGEAFPVLDTHWPAKAAEILGREVPFGAAFAWNPSAPGVKSEDTFLLLPDGRREIVSRTPNLPVVDLAAVLGRATECEKHAIAC